MIGERIREIRTMHGFTQEQMARSMGVRQNTWNQWENGRRQVPVTVLERLVREWNVDADYLLRGEPPVFRNTLTDSRWYF
jgi:transcriptional regulator with XRE-family HTH domain